MTRLSPAAAAAAAALVAAALLPAAGAQLSRAFFTHNYICRLRNCVNPIFPAIEQLGRDVMASQEARLWVCPTAAPSASALVADFCKDVIKNYEFAVPVADAARAELLTTVMRAEDSRATTAFATHLAAIGLDLTDVPVDDITAASPCVQSIWRTSCMVHFPQCATEGVDALAKAAVDAAPPDATVAEPVPVVAVGSSVALSSQVAALRAATAEANKEAEAVRASLSLLDVGRQRDRRGGRSRRASSSRAASRATWRAHPLGRKTIYLRPCASECESFVDHCAVECCDEGVQCVFSHRRVLPDGSEAVSRGFANQRAPSLLCTGHLQSGDGAASRGVASTAVAVAAAAAWGGRAPALFVAAAVAALSGLPRAEASLATTSTAAHATATDIVQVHALPRWRREPRYEAAVAFENPIAHAPSLNSCSIAASIVQYDAVCNGRGHCVRFSENAPGDEGPMFCRCQAGWAGLECEEARKSQSIAFAVSLFLGWTGADQFYLGFFWYGMLKLCSLGGLGALYLLDLAALANAPPTDRFHAADDLHRVVYVCSCSLFFSTLGLAKALYDTRQTRRAETKWRNGVARR